MSYLLWQIFWCLLGTALLFFVLGWLLKSRFAWNSTTDNLITDSERSSWQTSLDGLKARLEAETGRKLAAEKALEDSRGQQSKLSLLLDQHTTEIQTLTQELADKDKELDERDANVKQLQIRIAELESQQGFPQDFAKEREALNRQLAALTAQAGTRDQSLRAANEDLTRQRARTADLQKQVADRDAKLASLQAVSEENNKLKAQVSESAPKLAAAVAAGAEVMALRARVADLEPKLRAAAAETAKQVADRDAAIRTAADENKKLKDEIVQLQGQATKLQGADAETSKLRGQVADLEPKLRVAAEENDKLRTQVSELTPKLAMAAAAGAEVVALRAHVAQLEPQVSKLESSDVELGKLRGDVADLQQKLRSATDEANKLKGQIADRDTKLTTAAEEASRFKSQADEAHGLRTQLDDLTPKLTAATAAAAEDAKKLKVHADEVIHLKSQVRALESKLAEFEPQLSDRDAKLRTAHDELASFKKRWVEHEGKLHAVDEENSRLKTQLAEAQQQGAELTKLRFRIGELEPEFESMQQEIATLRGRISTAEPQIHQWETRYTSVVAEKDAELSKCRSRVAELEQLATPATVRHHAPGKGERDDLKKIFGIGPVLEKRLNGLGVYSFREIAMWTREDILRYEEHLKEFPNRIERDNWVEGAREEHFKKYGQRLLKVDSANA